MQVVTRQEIDRTGKTSLAEYLQTITADGAGSIPKTFGNGFAGGGAGISLRGLGAGSTLVLLNGRRMPMAWPMTARRSSPTSAPFRSMPSSAWKC